MRLRATHNPLVDSSHPSPPPAAAHHQHPDDAKKTSSRYWTADEHSRFLEGLRLFGQKDIKAIARHVGTRNATQVRTHAQKYYLRIERERAKAANDLKNSQKPSPSKPNGPIAKSEPMEQLAPNSVPNNSSNSHSNSLNNSASSTPIISNNPNAVISHPQVSPNPSAKQTSPNASARAPTAASPLQYPSDPLPSTSNSGQPQAHVPAKQASPSSSPITQPAAISSPTLQKAVSPEKPASSTKAVPSKSSKRPPSSALRRSPRKRAKPSVIKQSPPKTVPNPSTPSQSAPTPPPMPSSSTSPPDSDSQKDKSVKLENVIVTSKSQANTQLPPAPDQKASTINGSGGSTSNMRTWMRAVPGDETGPSASKPPPLRRNGSSNSVLAELSKNPGALSRSNSFVMQTGKGVTRSNSILSLLSGIPTVMRESPSTDRLLGLDTSDDKVLAALKAVDAAGNAAVAAGQTMTANNSIGTMGDRTFSFSQLNHMGFDDLEDTGAVALAIQDDQKWGDA
ncbi:SANT domain containing protein [Gracilaria domingensis]|nr:SANT domain containing protein [Gracilaria domingensis]